MILLLDLFFIAKDHGWHGLLMAAKVTIAISIILALVIWLVFALCGIYLFFTPEPPLLIFLGSSIWPRLLFWLASMGIPVYILWNIFSGKFVIA